MELIYPIISIIAIMTAIYFQDEIGLSFRKKEGYDKGGVSEAYIMTLVAIFLLWPVAIPVAFAAMMYQRKKNKAK